MIVMPCDGASVTSMVVMPRADASAFNMVVGKHRLIACHARPHHSLAADKFTTLSSASYAVTVNTLVTVAYQSP